MTQNIHSFISKYKHALLPVLYAPFYILIFIFLENRSVNHLHIIEMKIDNLIPFCEFFIIPYYLWFFYIAISVITFIFLDKNDYYRLCIILGIGMTLFLLISYLWPNGLRIRPTEFARDNSFIDLVKVLHKSDTSTNVFPSIHCFNSLAVHVAIMKNDVLKKKKGICITSSILCISILLSTLFLKQHSFADLLGAVIMYALLYFPIYHFNSKKNISKQPA